MNNSLQSNTIKYENKLARRINSQNMFALRARKNINEFIYRTVTEKYYAI